METQKISFFLPRAHEVASGGNDMLCRDQGNEIA